MNKKIKFLILAIVFFSFCLMLISIYKSSYFVVNHNLDFFLYFLLILQNICTILIGVGILYGK